MEIKKKKKKESKLEIYNAKLTVDDDFDEDDDYYDPYENMDNQGVVYTSSKTNESSRELEPRRSPQKQKPQPQASSDAAKKKRKKTNYTVFIIATVTTGIAVAILALILMFAVFSSNVPWGNNNLQGQQPTQSENQESTAANSGVPNEQQQSVTGIIKVISGKNIQLYIFATGEKQSFLTDNLTDIKDKYGKGISFAELNTGDIVDIGYFPSKDAVTSVQANSQVWVSRSITNVTADQETRTITIGNKMYVYTDELMFLNSDKLSDLANLSNSDVITVSGYKDQLWTVFVEKSQAYVQIVPNDRIKNGILEIDTNVFLQLTEPEYERIQVSEGQHRIVVKGDNIETYIQEIRLDAGQTYDLDLMEVQIKRCVLVMNVNTEDYNLFLNDVQQEVTSEPLVLEYGVYTIRVEKEDFYPYTNTFDIKQESATLNITLEEIPKECTATIETLPSGADIFLNNVFLGITPLNTTIPFGEHRLTARKTGYYEISVPLVVSLEEEKFLINLDRIPEEKPPETTDTDNNTNTTDEDVVDSFADTEIVDANNNETPDWLQNGN